jgi:hypothetical protein
MSSLPSGKRLYDGVGIRFDHSQIRLGCAIRNMGALLPIA